MWCIGLAPDAWNLSGRCQETQDAQDRGDATQDAQDATAPYLTQGNFLLMMEIWVLERHLLGNPNYSRKREVRLG